VAAEYKLFNFRKIPAECHRQVKLAAAEAETTMEEWVIEAVIEKLARVEGICEEADICNVTGPLPTITVDLDGVCRQVNEAPGRDEIDEVNNDGC